MTRIGDPFWTLPRTGVLLARVCLVGGVLLTVGMGRVGQAQTVSSDSQQTPPPGIERVRQRIEDIRRSPNQWRERLGTRLAPRDAPQPYRLEPRPPAEGELTRADLRRLERRLQTAVQDVLVGESEGPVRAEQIAEQFRVRPAGTARVEAPGADTVTVTDTVRAAPDTVRQTRVDVVERRLLDTGVFRGYEVNFAFGKSTLQPRATRTLDAVGDVVERYPKLRIEIGGHTDSIGTTAFNQQLSEARAGAVRTYLLDQFDIAPGRLVARGHGEAEPVAPNEERSGRALNRRVEFRVLNPDVVE